MCRALRGGGKKKDKENSIEFLKIYNHTQVEYEKSLLKIQKYSQNINDSHIASIISINKIISTHRHVLELFSYLTNGDFIFNWEKFRNELNIYETKYKMSHVQYEKINLKILSNILNKTMKDKNFSKEYFKEKEIGIYLLFKWIREVLKVFFYLEKQKNNSLEKNIVNNNIILRKITNKKKPQCKKIDIEFDPNLEEEKN